MVAFQWEEILEGNCARAKCGVVCERAHPAALLARFERFRGDISSTDMLIMEWSERHHSTYLEELRQDSKRTYA